MAKQKNNKALVVLNLLGLVGMLVVNTLANVLPLNGKNTGELSDSIPNLFVPAGRTFAIWGVIYALLILFVVYQIVIVRKETIKEDPIKNVGLLFFISCLANSLWIFAWHWQLQLPSLSLMLILLITLITIHTKVRKPDAPLGYRIAVMLPFSVYLGWIAVATIANVTSVAVVLQWNRFGFSEVFWTVAVLVVAISINLLAIIARGDIWFAAVGIWALYNIYTKRMLPEFAPQSLIAYTALIGAIVLAVAIVIHLIVKGRRVARQEV